MLLLLLVGTLHAEDGGNAAAITEAMSGTSIAGTWDVEESVVQGFCSGEPAEAAGSMRHLSWSAVVGGPTDVRVAISGTTGSPMVAGGFDLDEHGGLVLHLAGNASSAAGGQVTQAETEITLVPDGEGWSGKARSIRAGSTSKPSLTACFVESTVRLAAPQLATTAPPAPPSAATATSTASPASVGTPTPAAVSPSPVTASPTASVALPAAPGAEWASPTLGTMKWIPPGTFTMGRPVSESPSPQDGNEGEYGQHSVTLTRGYWLMEHEVTEAEWLAVTGEAVRGGCGADCPVTWTGWDAALAFVKKASEMDGVEYRLPTEAEWEYAARGGQNRVIGKPRSLSADESAPRSDYRYQYAGSDDPASVGWNSGNSRGYVHAVCGKTRNGYGLCDMSGNVSERVGNCYMDYPSESVVDPAPLLFSGCEHILRGGDYGGDAASTRVTWRSSDDRAYKNHSAGLRLVRAAP